MITGDLSDAVKRVTNLLKICRKQDCAKFGATIFISWIRRHHSRPRYERFFTRASLIPSAISRIPYLFITIHPSIHAYCYGFREIVRFNFEEFHAKQPDFIYPGLTYWSDLHVCCTAVFSAYSCPDDMSVYGWRNYPGINGALFCSLRSHPFFLGYFHL